MKLDKLLTGRFSSLSDIRRVGRDIISVKFKYRHEVNSFVDDVTSLLENWIGYIPNFKLYRTGIVRGVDLSLSEEEIRQGIGFPDNSIEIRFISRLKYRDRNTMELKNSSMIKVEFVSNLPPEFMNIWSVRVKVKPYVNKVHKCFNYFGWTSIFCKDKETCFRCGRDHNVDMCNSDGFCCVNYGGSHHPFDQFYPVFYKYKLKHSSCNVSQFKRLLKTKNIISIDQVEQVFKSSAYYDWNTLNIDIDLNLARGSSTPSIYKSNQDRSCNKYKGTKSRFTSNLEVIKRDSPMEVEDQTLIPDPVERDTVLEHCVDSAPGAVSDAVP